MSRIGLLPSKHGLFKQKSFEAIDNVADDNLSPKLPSKKDSPKILNPDSSLNNSKITKRKKSRRLSTIERAKLFRQSSSDQGIFERSVDAHNVLLGSSLSHTMFGNNRSSRSDSIYDGQLAPEAHDTKAQQIPLLPLGPLSRCFGEKNIFKHQGIHSFFFDYEMFSIFYFLIFCCGILIIIQEVVLYNASELMQRWKTYENSNSGAPLFVNTFSFQLLVERQYYLYAFFVFFLCIVVIDKADYLFNASILIIVREMMIAIADVFFFFMILLMALGLWGFMAFGDRYDAYGRITDHLQRRYQMCGQCGL